MDIWAIVLAAGSGKRLSGLGVGIAKQFLPLQGVPLYWHSAKVFSRIPSLKGLIFVMPAPDSEDDCEDALMLYTKEINAFVQRAPFGLKWAVVLGGKERQDSVRQALAALPLQVTHVLIHDAARPFLSAGLVERVIQGLRDGESGVVPVVEVADTIKEVSSEGLVEKTLVRSTLRAVQTPQGFCLQALMYAHESAQKKGMTGTDDASLLEICGIKVRVVPGDFCNKKITYPEDLVMLETNDAMDFFPCTGFGYDVHRYGGERTFILGGVPIVTDITVAAHSDGDTLLHALIDAILGCIGKGDIGGMFPDTAPEFAGVSSGVLLAEVVELSIREGLKIHHVDFTIVAQTPRLTPHKEAIAKNVAKLLQLPAYAVNVKATTEEKMGFTGEKKGIKVMALVTGIRKRPK